MIRDDEILCDMIQLGKMKQNTIWCCLPLAAYDGNVTKQNLSNWHTVCHLLPHSIQKAHCITNLTTLNVLATHKSDLFCTYAQSLLLDTEECGVNISESQACCPA